MKKFLFYWTSGVYIDAPKIAIVYADFISDANGFDQNNIDIIMALEEGQNYTFDGVSVTAISPELSNIELTQSSFKMYA